MANQKGESLLALLADMFARQTIQPPMAMNPMLMAQNQIQLPPALEQQYKQYRIQMGEQGQEPLKADEWMRLLQQQTGSG